MSNEENISTDIENFSNISETSTLKHNEKEEEEIDKEIMQESNYSIQSLI